MPVLSVLPAAPLLPLDAPPGGLPGADMVLYPRHPQAVPSALPMPADCLPAGIGLRDLGGWRVRFAGRSAQGPPPPRAVALSAGRRAGGRGCGGHVADHQHNRQPGAYGRAHAQLTHRHGERAAPGARRVGARPGRDGLGRAGHRHTALRGGGPERGGHHAAEGPAGLHGRGHAGRRVGRADPALQPAAGQGRRGLQLGGGGLHQGQLHPHLRRRPHEAEPRLVELRHRSGRLH